MNIPINSRIIYLWQQFSAQTATRAELDELFGLLTSAQPQEESRQYLQQMLESFPPAEVDRERWAPVLEQILRPADGSEKQPESHVKYPGADDAGRWGQDSGRQMRTLSYWILRAGAAVAAVLLMCVAAIYLWRGPVSKTPMVLVSFHVVAPGSNKAVLTLSDGEKITLDSAATGLLASQGNTHIKKLGDGEIAYEPGGKKGDKPFLNTLATPRGGQYQLTLPDGTKVWLNASSSITYPASFTGNERTIEMSGEAYFEVAKDHLHPFTIKTAGRVIEDIGTHFNVNAYNDEPAMVTTLLEGAVQVDGHLLKPGEQATARPAGAVEVATGDPARAVAWKNGQFNFSDADLKTVMRQLSRWYNVDIKYEGDIPARRFSGMIGRSLTLGQLLSGLTKERVHYRIEGNNQLIITP